MEPDLVQPAALLARDNALCTNCQAIDFDTISCMRGLRKQQKGGVGTYLHDLSYPANENCPLCSLFSDLKRTHTKLPKKVKWRLTARSAATMYSDHLPDSIILTIEPASANRKYNIRDCLLFTNDESVLSGRLLLSTVDWDIVKEWLDFCHKHHSIHCSRGVRFDVPGFRLIDCQTRMLVKAQSTEVEYLTLSYVWGKDHAEHMIGHQLPDKLPRTIADAIEATKSLGFRYIWIDRYCIDQADSASKFELITCMGKIYGNSVLTLIAAMGDNPDFGLPGVEHTTRRPQQRVRVGCHVLTRFSADNNDVIIKSKWNTRGWTFQEALLSRRKIVFTDQCVVFQCRGMHCAEDLSIPLQALHTKDMQQFRGEVFLPKAFPMQGVGKDPREIWARISEFCAREITFDEDVPRAFEGIFQQFASMRIPMQQVYGIPIFGPRSFSSGQQDLSARFVYGLSWNIRNSFKVTRRNVFPSWTWMEWDLCVTCSLHPLNLFASGRLTSRSFADIDLISIELADGRVLTPDTLQSDNGSVSALGMSPAYLTLFGSVFELELTRDGDFYYETHDINRNHKWDIFLSGPRPQKLDVSCLVLGYTSWYSDVMVMLQANDGVFERIGCESINAPHRNGETIASALARRLGCILRKMNVRMK